MVIQESLTSTEQAAPAAAPASGPLPGEYGHVPLQRPHPHHARQGYGSSSLGTAPVHPLARYWMERCAPGGRIDESLPKFSSTAHAQAATQDSLHRNDLSLFLILKDLSPNIRALVKASFLYYKFGNVPADSVASEIKLFQEILLKEKSAVVDSRAESSQPVAPSLP